jgi:hypothetical protein
VEILSFFGVTRHASSAAGLYTYLHSLHATPRHAGRRRCPLTHPPASKRALDSRHWQIGTIIGGQVAAYSSMRRSSDDIDRRGRRHPRPPRLGNDEMTFRDPPRSPRVGDAGVSVRFVFAFARESPAMGGTVRYCTSTLEHWCGRARPGREHGFVQTDHRKGGGFFFLKNNWCRCTVCIQGSWIDGGQGDARTSTGSMGLLVGSQGTALLVNARTRHGHAQYGTHLPAAQHQHQHTRLDTNRPRPLHAREIASTQECASGQHRISHFQVGVNFVPCPGQSSVTPTCPSSLHTHTHASGMAGPPLSQSRPPHVCAYVRVSDHFGWKSVAAKEDDVGTRSTVDGMGRQRSAEQSNACVRACVVLDPCCCFCRTIEQSKKRQRQRSANVLPTLHVLTQRARAQKPYRIALHRTAPRSECSVHRRRGMRYCSVRYLNKCDGRHQVWMMGGKKSGVTQCNAMQCNETSSTEPEPEPENQNPSFAPRPLAQERRDATGVLTMGPHAGPQGGEGD